MRSVSSDTMEIDCIDVDNAGSPRKDGSPGSGLYVVPIRLKQTPSPTWASLFPGNWDHPQEWSSRHRPGIAQVVGDTIVLNGTTVEEVRDVHAKTLTLAVEATNEQVTAIAERERLACVAAERQRTAHEANIREVASEVRFDQ
jgi:hypothetical protein